MVATRSWRATALGALASMVMLAGIAAPVAASNTFVLDLPAGLACQFDLRISGTGNDPQVTRTFGDGAIALTAGKGYALTYTNLSTQASISTKANGSVTWTTTNPDGSQQLILMGNNVVILFPADGGPSTKVYSGLVVIGVAPDGAWTVQKVAASVLDVCAALS
jgi:hypothetical protein